MCSMHAARRLPKSCERVVLYCGANDGHANRVAGILILLLSFEKPVASRFLISSDTYDDHARKHDAGGWKALKYLS